MVTALSCSHGLFWSQLPATAQGRQHLNMPIKGTPATHHTSCWLTISAAASNSVFICLDEENTTNWGPYNNKDLFLKILETGKSKSKVRADSVSDKSLFPSLEAVVFSLLSYGRRRERELPGVSSIRALIPFTRAPHSWPNYLPKAHLQISSRWGLDINIMNSRGTHSLYNNHHRQSFLNSASSKVILLLLPTQPFPFH